LEEEYTKVVSEVLLAVITLQTREGCRLRGNMARNAFIALNRAVTWLTRVCQVAWCSEKASHQWRIKTRRSGAIV